MGKNRRRHRLPRDGGCDYELPSAGAYDASQSDVAASDSDEAAAAEPEDYGDRHALYQRAVQAPKGEISYILKFFLTYIGGRTPLCMREDFCGTALICAEWVRADARRTAIGVDLDEDALSWGLKNNISKLKGDAASRVHLYKQNVLEQISDSAGYSLPRPTDVQAEEAAVGRPDVVCALNFSCCCLQSRKDLVSYFRRAFEAISNRGGLFVMDLYGGLSSEQPLKIRRRYNGFTYIWEQDEFNIVKRTTRISLHFQLNQPKRTLRHAFSYHWRLWTLPEITDCLEEAGFSSSHVWLCERPELKSRSDFEEKANEALEYEEVVQGFNQCDSWNAYVVGVRHPH